MRGDPKYAENIRAAAGAAIMIFYRPSAVRWKTRITSRPLGTSKREIVEPYRVRLIAAVQLSRPDSFQLPALCPNYLAPETAEAEIEALLRLDGR